MGSQGRDRSPDCRQGILPKLIARYQARIPFLEISKMNQDNLIGEDITSIKTALTEAALRAEAVWGWQQEEEICKNFLHLLKSLLSAIAMPFLGLAWRKISREQSAKSES